MDRDTLRQYILENYAAVNDFPWISNPTYEVFRHESSKKWFALVMEIPRSRLDLKGEDIEVVVTHSNQYGEEYYSFVNGQHTTQGGTHLSAFKESVGRVIKEYYNKNFEYSDIRAGIVAAISIKVEEPVFESQTKTKLGSKDIGPDGPTVAKFIGDFIKNDLDNYLHKNMETSELLLKKILESEKERKAIALSLIHI